MRLPMIAGLAVVVGVLNTCSIGTLLGSAGAGSPEEVAAWTVVVILCGDNELEEKALADLNEMEAIDLTGTGIDVVAAVDRASGYDVSNGDWTGTRLFAVEYDPGGVNHTIVSPAIPCPPLGIDVTNDVEVDLTAASTLSILLDYATVRFPSQRRAVVIWGQGSGWRSVAYDSSSGDYLYTPEFAAALRDPIDVIALDTSFGATLELAYELRSSDAVLIASQDQVDTFGWRYDSFLSMLADSDGSVASFVDAAAGAYELEYSGHPTATISAVDLGEADGVAAGVSDLARSVIATITDSSVRSAYRNAFFYDVEDFYTTPGDLFVDLYDLADVAGVTASGPQAASVVTAAAHLNSAIEQAVIHTWSGSANPRAHGLSIHLIPLLANGIAASSHDDAYIRGRPVMFPLRFVMDSAWVPNLIDGSGLLFHLFYAPI